MADWYNFRDLVTPLVRSRQTLVLCYHDIEAGVSSPSTKFGVTRENFRAQMALIHDMGFVFVTFDEITRPLGREERPLQCAVCFDDCGSGTVLGAAAIEQYAGRATFYAIANRIREQRSENRRHQHLDPQALRRLSDAGHEIGSHSVSHRNMGLLSDEEAFREATDSKAMISDIIGKEVTSFCYPFGRYNASTPRLVEAAGYRNAAALLGPKQDPARPLYEINRSVILARDTENRFLTKLAQCGERTRPLKLGFKILHSLLRQHS